MLWQKYGISAHSSRIFRNQVPDLETPGFQESGFPISGHEKAAPKDGLSVKKIDGGYIEIRGKRP